MHWILAQAWCHSSMQPMAPQSCRDSWEMQLSYPNYSISLCRFQAVVNSQSLHTHSSTFNTWTSLLTAAAMRRVMEPRRPAVRKDPPLQFSTSQDCAISHRSLCFFLLTSSCSLGRPAPVSFSVNRLIITMCNQLDRAERVRLVVWWDVREDLIF